MVVGESADEPTVGFIGQFVLGSPSNRSGIEVEPVRWPVINARHRRVTVHDQAADIVVCSEERLTDPQQILADDQKEIQQAQENYTQTVLYHGATSDDALKAKNKWDDAFYQYTDAYGNAITPVHTSTYPGWTLWINGGVADNYVNPIPAYNSNHVYSFTIHLQQTGYLTFAIGDTYTKDNTGSLSLIVTQEN